MLDGRKDELKNFGVLQYKPWVIMISDGLSTDGAELDHQSSQLMRGRIDNEKATVVAVAVGEHHKEAEHATRGLQVFAPNNTYRLDGIKFEEFFVFLSQSTVAQNRSDIDENFEIDFSKTDCVKKIDDLLA